MARYGRQPWSTLRDLPWSEFSMLRSELQALAKREFAPPKK